MIKVTLDDGAEVSFPAGITCQEVLQEWKGQNTEAVAALVDGRECDLTTSLSDNCRLEFIDFGSPAGARVYRHTASHILAQAV
ncbi:MAG TPA: TGS domain-containing protein, partial [Firmicutes bacterium]|nr:TGS domain-containing protein [Bacillota bacterium]